MFANFKKSDLKLGRTLILPTLFYLLVPASGQASISYSYITDQSSYSALPGATVPVIVYLKETLSGTSTSLIASDGGLLGAGWSVSRTGVLPGSPSVLSSLAGSVTTNGSDFPGGFFSVKSGGSSIFMAGDNAVSASAANGPSPNASGLIELGVIDITAGSSTGTTSFQLANYAYPAATDGFTDTFKDLYNLDATKTGANAYTGASSTPETFTISVGGIPSNLSSGSYSSATVVVGGPQNSIVGGNVLNVSGSGQLTASTSLTVYGASGDAVNLSGGSIVTSALSVLSPGTFSWTGGKLGIGGVATSMNAASMSNIAVTSMNSYTPATGKPTRSVLVASAVTFGGTTNSWTGTLDVANNDVIVTGVGSSGLSSLTNQIKEANNKGAWNGPGGIFSSTAASNNSHLTTLGIILNNNGSGTAIYSTFDGISSGTSDVLIKYTYFGDANLDGMVDGSDYTRIDNGFNQHLTGWFNGDFNYDGVVDGSDYTLIDNAFNGQAASLAATTGLVATATAQIASTSVPEPALSFAAVLLSISLCRRRLRSIANAAHD